FPFAAGHGHVDARAVQESRVAAPADGGAGDKIHLELGVAEAELPAVAEVHALAGIQGIVAPHDCDWNPGHRDGQVRYRELLPSQLQVTLHADVPVELGCQII